MSRDLLPTYGGCVCQRPTGRFAGVAGSPAMEPGWWKGGTNWSLSPYLFGVVTEPPSQRRRVDDEDDAADDAAETRQARQARRRQMREERRAARASRAPQRLPRRAARSPEERARRQAQAAQAAQTARRVAQELLSLAPAAADAASELVQRFAPAQEASASAAVEDEYGDGLDAFGMAIEQPGWMPGAYDDEWFGPEGSGAADSFRNNGFSWQMVADPLYGGMPLFGGDDIAPGGALATTKALLWPTPETWAWWRKRMAKGDHAAALADAWREFGSVVSDKTEAAKVAAATELFATRLVGIRATLTRMKAAIASDAQRASLSADQLAVQDELARRFNAMNARYYKLATPFYAESYPLDAATGQPAVASTLVAAATRAGVNLMRAVRGKPSRGRGRTLAPGMATGIAGVLYGGAATFGECILARDFRQHRGDADFGDGTLFGFGPQVVAVLKGAALAVTAVGAAWALAQTPAMLTAWAQKLSNDKWCDTVLAMAKMDKPMPAGGPPVVAPKGGSGPVIAAVVAAALAAAFLAGGRR